MLVEDLATGPPQTYIAPRNSQASRLHHVWHSKRGRATQPKKGLHHLGRDVRVEHEDLAGCRTIRGILRHQLQCHSVGPQCATRLKSAETCVLSGAHPSGNLKTCSLGTSLGSWHAVLLSKNPTLEGRVTHVECPIICPPTCWISCHVTHVRAMKIVMATCGHHFVASQLPVL